MHDGFYKMFLLFWWSQKLKYDFSQVHFFVLIGIPSIQSWVTSTTWIDKKKELSLNFKPKAI